MWACDRCTLHNDAACAACAACGGARPARPPTPPAQTACQQCAARVDVGAVYILDACDHRFCLPCIRAHVAGALREGLGADVACLACGTALSVRDLQDLVRAGRASDAAPTAGAAAGGSRHATRRLMRELRTLEPLAGTVEAYTVGESLYEWEVLFTGFDPDADDADEAALARDLAGRPVVLRVCFSSSYPTTPPYVRVLRPRFRYRTGHVTVGGSFCSESLTTAGWDESMTVESVLLGVRANLISGRGRLDQARTGDYGAGEAREAFDRMRREHNWY